MVYSADRLSWYENGASSNKSALFDWSGAEHLIDVRLSGVRDLVLVDLNRDGHYDLAKVQSLYSIPNLVWMSHRCRCCLKSWRWHVACSAESRRRTLTTASRTTSAP